MGQIGDKWCNLLGIELNLAADPNAKPDTLVMQGDGNLVAYSTEGQPMWASGTMGDNYFLEFDGYPTIYRDT